MSFMVGRTDQVHPVRIGGGDFTVIAGPCQIETRDHAINMAQKLAGIVAEFPYMQFIYKSSFDKANRTSIKGARGAGIDEGLRILSDVRRYVGRPVTTDVHEPWQCQVAADVVDMLQIPALLCRQTDLLVAAAETGLPVNIKKGQFMSPWDMRYAVDKVKTTSKAGVAVTERGTTFGYNNLVVDMRSLLIMPEVCDCPVIFDGTHSVQLPGIGAGQSGGNRQYIHGLTRAAAAIGIDALFLEVHETPETAPSDGPVMLTPEEFWQVLCDINDIRTCGAHRGMVS